MHIMIPGRPFDELLWVSRMRGLLDEDTGEDDEIAVSSILKVPKALSAGRPEAYAPQVVALGPYHHSHPELQGMERHKLLAAKRVQKQFLHGVRLQHLVDDFVKFEFMIRANYHRYLDLNGETLAWMMAIDASFLIDFLQIYDATVPKKRIPSPGALHLSDNKCSRRCSHDMIRRDAVVFENQVPLFLLQKIARAQCAPAGFADEVLLRMLVGFVKDVSPFKSSGLFLRVGDVARHPHLLDLIYRAVVPKSDIYEIQLDDDQQLDSFVEADERPTDLSCVAQTLQNLQELALQLLWSAISCARRAVISICLKTVTTLPVFLVLRHPPFEQLFSSDNCREDPVAEQRQTQTTSVQQTERRPLLAEEIAIPSVAELADAGVRFLPVDGGIPAVGFDAGTGTFRLPVLTLDAHSEVVLRNLVAYEVSVVDGPCVLARYAEVMSGVVDTAEDVRLLRECGVVVNHMRSDQEAADLWNGMSRAAGLTRVPPLDKVVGDVNGYYGSKWRVKVRRLLRRKGINGARQLPVLLFSSLLIFLVSLQAFCLLRGCKR